MSTDKGDCQILIVEDNPGDYALVEDLIFERFETPIITHAKTFKEAKQTLTQAGHTFQIVLLDLSLPDHTGERLINEILELCGPLPVIVLTGYANFAFGLRSLSMGISDYLLKDDLTSTSLYKSIVYSIERKSIASALETSEKSVRSFANQLNNALEEERSRIAREIHDEFGQQLSGLKMALSSLKRSKGINNDMELLIGTLITDVNTSIESVRQIANELRPVLIDKFGLLAAIEWLICEFEKKTGIASKFYGDIDLPELTKMMEINIFRICQEALTNITKHAKATLVNIIILKTENHLNIKITDNGTGINANIFHNPLSMGLLNMKERANLIDAELHISSSASPGTLIELILNINGQKNINSRRPLSN